MHLLEAALAWFGATLAPSWKALAREIAALALTAFIDPRGGCLREAFATDWRPAPGTEGRIVEPGHQFEWAWLLLRWGRVSGWPEVETAARRLIAIGEDAGSDPRRGVTINALLDDLSIHDAGARLWPQTERIKAGAALATAAGDPAGWEIAAKGAEALLGFLDTPVRGLWRDRMKADGSFVDEPAPASSFYHIVCAVAELDRAVEKASGYC
jgi:mannose-6-phosphate isomerase